MTNEQLKQSAKDEAARENGFNDWDDVITYNLSFGLSNNKLEVLINRAMEIYAERVGEAQYEKGYRDATSEAIKEIHNNYKPLN